MSMTREQRLKEITSLLAEVRSEGVAPDLQPAAEPLVRALEGHHAEAVHLIGRREFLRASLREASAQLRATFKESHECVMALRSLHRLRKSRSSPQAPRFGSRPMGGQGGGSGKEPAAHRRAG